MPLIGKLFVVVNKNLLYLDVYLISKSRYDSLSNPSHTTYGYYGKSAIEYIKEFTDIEVVGYGRTHRVLTYQYERAGLRMYDYYCYLVKIRDIEEYKKKREVLKNHKKKDERSKKKKILLTDGYKLDHRRQYPQGTEYVYSKKNWTPRSCHYFFPEAEEWSCCIWDSVLH